jgi:hypothetical protein
MFSPYLIIAFLLALIASSLGGYSFGYDVAADEYKAEILSLQNDANKQLAEKTREALDATEKQIQTAQQLEISHHEANQKIDAALAVNRTLKLRVKSTTSRCAAVPESSSSGVAADQSKDIEFELPRAITDDLFGLAASADRVSNYADTCYRWVRSIE